MDTKKYDPEILPEIVQKYVDAKSALFKEFERCIRAYQIGHSGSSQNYLSDKDRSDTLLGIEISDVKHYTNPHISDRNIRAWFMDPKEQDWNHKFGSDNISMQSLVMTDQEIIEFIQDTKKKDAERRAVQDAKAEASRKQWDIDTLKRLAPKYPELIKELANGEIK